MGLIGYDVLFSALARQCCLQFRQTTNPTPYVRMENVREYWNSILNLATDKQP